MLNPDAHNALWGFLLAVAWSYTKVPWPSGGAVEDPGWTDIAGTELRMGREAASPSSFVTVTEFPG